MKENKSKKGVFLALAGVQMCIRDSPHRGGVWDNPPPTGDCPWRSSVPLPAGPGPRPGPGRQGGRVGRQMCIRDSGLTVSALEEALRAWETPIVGRVSRNRYLLDVRTLTTADWAEIVRALDAILR